MQHIRFGIAVLFMLVYCAGVCAFTIVTLGLFSNLLVHALVRVFGRTLLAIIGVRLEVEGVERVAGRAPRILVFAPHTSLLDLAAISAVVPRGIMAIGKKELLYVPVLGVCYLLLRQVLVDRSNPERARASLAGAARRVNDEKRTALIAPEGTRSRDGQLLPFKMGTFHLALASRAPIVPMILLGAYDLMPRRAWINRRGAVKVRFYEPISTEHWTEAGLKEECRKLRDFYLRELGQGDA